MSALQPHDTRGENWASFAGVVFVVLGMFNILDAIALYSNDSYFNGNGLLFGNLSLWATLYIVIGALQLVTAMLVFRGAVAGALLGITLAVVNAILALLAVGAYPLWAMIILALDGAVIYALTAHGDALSSAN